MKKCKFPTFVGIKQKNTPEKNSRVLIKIKNSNYMCDNISFL